MIALGLLHASNSRCTLFLSVTNRTPVFSVFFFFFFFFFFFLDVYKRQRINRAEADLLAALARRCTADDEEWAVIVPYRAQAALIRNLLKDLPPGTGDIATVDSFQGGERDVVLYGFTRSNPSGEVGFLDELRRANVAFTRARRRLILVGDFDTLTRATDEGFRDLARALREHTADVGELLPSRDLEARLGARTA
ncbi:C-terminal helicase domain-containing protein [Streptomyces sp. V2]|uniref:C-terminal helicase domain-containing protein n=1 Tax=Streptomyces sp. V2 TaxID=1424099 RepID=UPI0019D24886|nr:C-terminal helicase domain-containing protein [Streptomyces sp. V2]